MNSDEFNEIMNDGIRLFLEGSMGLIDEYCESNQLSPSHGLITMFYTMFGAVRMISDNTWRTAESLMNEIIKVGEKLQALDREDHR
jgi:hypothetical protein